MATLGILDALYHQIDEGLRSPVYLSGCFQSVYQAYKFLYYMRDGNVIVFAFAELLVQIRFVFRVEEADRFGGVEQRIPKVVRSSLFHMRMAACKLAGLVDARRHSSGELKFERSPISARIIAPILLPMPGIDVMGEPISSIILSICSSASSISALNSRISRIVC